MENNITLSDFTKFVGGWSLSPYSIYLSIKYVTYDKTLKILEFGSGDGTNKLVEFLTNKNIDFKYTSVEHDINYANTHNVEYLMYPLTHNYVPKDIENIDIQLNGIYDLIIIDGPHGVGRSKWYDKIKNFVKKGTIILIDDFHHYVEFETELNKVFEYDVVNVVNIDKRFTPTTINEGMEIVDINSPHHGNKTHKIVRIITTK
jgi:predicted O-methyltransferase YrrM